MSVKVQNAVFQKWRSADLRFTPRDYSFVG